MFLQAGSPAELRAYMAQYPDSRCIAGGTDIMPVHGVFHICKSKGQEKA